MVIPAALANITPPSAAFASHFLAPLLGSQAVASLSQQEADIALRISHRRERAASAARSER